MPLPPPDACRDLLHAAGWSLGEVRTAGGTWLVDGANGENRLAASGRTQAEAWRRAVEQARSLGMLGRGDRGHEHHAR